MAFAGKRRIAASEVDGLEPGEQRALSAYISMAPPNSEDSRGTARLTETDLAANREAFALRCSDTDLWTTAAPLLPTRNSEEPEIIMSPDSYFGRYRPKA